MDSISERLPENATVQERYEKYEKIMLLLKPEGIKLKSISNGSPVLADESCGFVMTHNIITWDIYPVTDVADMIIVSRNNYLERNVQ